MKSTDGRMSHASGSRRVRKVSSASVPTRRPPGRLRRGYRWLHARPMILDSVMAFLVLVAASVLATASRYLALRFWVFGRLAPQDASTPHAAVAGRPPRAPLTDRAGR